MEDHHIGRLAGMRSLRWTLRGVAVAAVCLVMCASIATAGHADTRSDTPPGVGEGIPWNGSTVRVPPPGMGIRVTDHMIDGTERSLLVVTSVDGVVTVVDGRDDQVGAVEVAASGPKPACRDGAYRLDSGPWPQTYAWWFKANTTPTGTSRSAALGAIKRSVHNITHGRNDCGRADRIDARSRYLGVTTKVETCFETLGFGRNVVRFGSLPRGVAGQAEVCYDLVDDEFIPTMANVVFNKRERWATKRAGCRDRALLEEVGTHEFGHVFGLDHVNGRAHSRLTMTPATYPCNAAGITLGLGDMRGLERLYPLG